MLYSGSEMKSLDEWNPVFAMTAIEFAFAIVNILLKKVLDKGMNHLVLITYRLSISAIFLAPIGYFWERNTRPKLTFRISSYLFISAIVGASLTQYFFLLGIQYTSATFACAFINMVPVVTFIMALPFGLEKVNLKSSTGIAKMLGTMVCVGGAMLLTLYKGMPLINNSPHSESMSQRITVSSSRKTERWEIGSVALLAGTVLWSLWFLLQSKIGKIYPCQYSSTAIMSFLGAIQSAILCWFLETNHSIWVLKGNIEILTILYAGIIGSGLCYVGMSWCVKKKGPVFTAAFSPLIQIMAAMFGIPFMHEQLHLGSLLGSIAVIVGLYILLWGKNKEAQCVAIQKLGHGTEDFKNQEPQLQVVAVTCDSRCP